MKRVNVNFRNRDQPCRRCGVKVGDIGKECYKTSGRASRAGSYYCIECGDIVQDSTKRVDKDV